MELALLGLTKNEAKAYRSLIERGNSSASEIAASSSVPYGRIYPVLESLIRKGFAKKVNLKPAAFAPSDPRHLMDAIKEKEDEIEATKEKLLSLKKIYDRSDQKTIEIVEGKKNFNRLLTRRAPAQKSERMVKYSFDLNPASLRLTKEQLGGGTSLKVIGRIDDETGKNVREWQKMLPVKAIDNTGVALSIKDDSEVWIILPKKDTNIIITDNDLAKVLSQLYDAYYVSAPEGNL